MTFEYEYRDGMITDIKIIKRIRKFWKQNTMKKYELPILRNYTETITDHKNKGKYQSCLIYEENRLVGIIVFQMDDTTMKDTNVLSLRYLDLDNRLSNEAITEIVNTVVDRIKFAKRADRQLITVNIPVMYQDRFAGVTDGCTANGVLFGGDIRSIIKRRSSDKKGLKLVKLSDRPDLITDGLTRELFDFDVMMESMSTDPSDDGQLHTGSYDKEYVNTLKSWLRKVSSKTWIALMGDKVVGLCTYSGGTYFIRHMQISFFMITSSYRRDGLGSIFYTRVLRKMVKDFSTVSHYTHFANISMRKMSERLFGSPISNLWWKYIDK